ncbi:MAG: hypothetical protein JETCAE01_35150 [Anaerolineaceae bacterium]|nr:MAG: hypothetical protein JETCAE01_35150 [Anaerolineaceae bacterium]
MERYLREVVELLKQRARSGQAVQYENLLKRGKEKKVALTACMRKFLTILNAMMRDQVPFRQRVIV